MMKNEDEKQSDLPYHVNEYKAVTEIDIGRNNRMIKITSQDGLTTIFTASVVGIQIVTESEWMGDTVVKKYYIDLILRSGQRCTMAEYTNRENARRAYREVIEAIDELQDYLFKEDC